MHIIISEWGIVALFSGVALLAAVLLGRPFRGKVKPNELTVETGRKNRSFPRQTQKTQKQKQGTARPKIAHTKKAIRGKHP
jgi:hypothetical protein